MTLSRAIQKSLDQSESRVLLQNKGKGQMVLDLFCVTCSSFSTEEVEGGEFA